MPRTHLLSFTVICCVTGCAGNNASIDPPVQIDANGMLAASMSADIQLREALEGGAVNWPVLLKTAKEGRRDAILVYAWVSMRNRTSDCANVLDLLGTLPEDPVALYLLGLAHANAYGVDRNHAKAYELFSASRSKGLSVAAIDMARSAWLSPELANDPQLRANMYALISNMANCGYVRAIGLQGVFKLHGYGCEINSYSGRLLIEEAARAHDLDSMIKLAALYGKEGDLNKANDLLVEAVRKRNAYAMMMLSEIKKLTGDVKSADTLRRCAVSLFDEAALVNEAALLAEGGDYFNACVYYELAARMGLPLGRDYCDGLYAKHIVNKDHVLRLTSEFVKTAKISLTPPESQRQPPKTPTPPSQP